MSILGNDYARCTAVPCEVDSNYVDRSLYLDDATFLIEALNPRIVQNRLRRELEVLHKVGMDENCTAQDFADQAEHLFKLARVYAQIDRLKNQVK